MNTLSTGAMSFFGARLREERERLGLTQDAFAEACGVRRRAQAHYEAGERYPDAQYLEAAAKVGVDLRVLFSGQRANGIEDALNAETHESLLYCLMFALGYEDHEARAWITKAQAETKVVQVQGKELSEVAPPLMDMAEIIVKKSRRLLSR
ncbi:helix-turn-helix domain-containing protein [Burkholderia cepacia]|uniref:helix-turn-helix domain-containing protein n=1 Tax=Burkholderia cepacia TaxID=292 RepID=UPI003EE1F608